MLAARGTSKQAGQGELHQKPRLYSRKRAKLSSAVVCASHRRRWSTATTKPGVSGRAQPHPPGDSDPAARQSRIDSVSQPSSTPWPPTTKPSKRCTATASRASTATTTRPRSRACRRSSKSTKARKSSSSRPWSRSTAPSPSPRTTPPTRRRRTRRTTSTRASRRARTPTAPTTTRSWRSRRPRNRLCAASGLLRRGDGA